DEIAEEYKRAKQQAWRLCIEHFTLFKLVGDLSGKSVLDLACGEGFYTRFIKRRGAARAVGVDISHGMIELARREEERNRLGIDYLVQDAKRLALDETFDVVVAGYLLNYAQTYSELLEMCSAITRHLKPGCRFVSVNNNPLQQKDYFTSTRKYGFIKSADGPLNEETLVDYFFFENNESCATKTYHRSSKTYAGALKPPELNAVTWYDLEVSPDKTGEPERKYWSIFIEHPPIIFIECVK